MPFLRVLTILAIASVWSFASAQQTDENTSAQEADISAQTDALSLYSGDWTGELEGFGLILVLHIEGSSIETARLTLDSPAQGAFGIEGQIAEVTDQRFVGGVSDLNAKIDLARQGDQLVGTFTQGIQIDLVMDRTDQTASEASLNRPQTDSLARDYQIEQVQFAGGAEGVTLAGELTLPKATAPKALLILISGSGPQNRDEELAGHKPFLVLSDYLTRAGYGVLRYDDRGTAESSGDFGAATTLDFAKDASAAMAYLESREDLSDLPVGLIGHSEGGLIAPLAAKITRPDMMILLAGPSQSLSKVIIRQGRDIAIAGGADQSLADIQERQAKARFELLRTTPAEDREIALTAQLIEDGLPEEAAADAARQFSSPWMLWAFDYDPVPDIAAYDGPVLALYGEKDLQVAPDANVPDMTTALSHPTSDVRVLAGLNHLFQPADTGTPAEYARIETTFDEDAMAEIVSWLDALGEE